MKKQNLLQAAISSMIVLAACSVENDLAVHGAWIREAPPSATVMAGYLVIENSGSAPRQLLGATSTAFNRVQMHATVTAGNRTRMIHESSIDLPPGDVVVFEPGGRHLMLMDPQEELAAGATVVISFLFDGDDQRDISFTVRRSIAD